MGPRDCSGVFSREGDTLIQQSRSTERLHAPAGGDGPTDFVAISECPCSLMILECASGPSTVDGGILAPDPSSRPEGPLLHDASFLRWALHRSCAHKNFRSYVKFGWRTIGSKPSLPNSSLSRVGFDSGEPDPRVLALGLAFDGSPPALSSFLSDPCRVHFLRVKRRLVFSTHYS